MTFIVVNYKSVVFFQEASGLWSDKLIKMLRGYSSPQDLVEKQTDEEVKKLAPEIVLTLVGIKILKTHFKENIKEWRFVVAKAIQ